MNKFNFDSENLVVDYISFNSNGLITLKPIANYFFEKFDFNSTIAKGSDRKTEFLIYDQRNQSKVSFRQLNIIRHPKVFGKLDLTFLQEFSINKINSSLAEQVARLDSDSDRSFKK